MTFGLAILLANLLICQKIVSYFFFVDSFRLSYLMKSLCQACDSQTLGFVYIFYNSRKSFHLFPLGLAIILANLLSPKSLWHTYNPHTFFFIYSKTPKIIIFWVDDCGLSMLLKSYLMYSTLIHSFYLHI